MRLPVVQGNRLFQEKCMCLNLVIPGMNGFVAIHRGLIVWEDGATPLWISYKKVVTLALPELGIPSRDTGHGMD